MVFCKRTSWSSILWFTNHREEQRHPELRLLRVLTIGPVLRYKLVEGNNIQTPKIILDYRACHVDSMRVSQ